MPCICRSDRGIFEKTLPERGHARNTRPLGKTEFALNRANQPPDWSDDALFGGQLTLRQHKQGHRAGTDAVLLASCLPRTAQGYAVDAGAASGAVGLMLAHRAPFLSIDLIEIDPKEAALAQHNIHANGFEARCRIVQADLLASEAAREAAGLKKGAADFVLSNPPYLTRGTHRISPDADRARAHSLPEDGLAHWCRALTWLAAPDALLLLIHRADGLPDLLQALDGRFGGMSLTPLYPRPSDPASRIIIKARKGSRAPLAIEAGIILHEPDGRFTPQARALHAGEI